jgi:hypothetical protein
MKRVREGMVENELDALYHYFSKKYGGVHAKVFIYLFIFY